MSRAILAAVANLAPIQPQARGAESPQKLRMQAGVYGSASGLVSIEQDRHRVCKLIVQPLQFFEVREASDTFKCLFKLSSKRALSATELAACAEHGGKDVPVSMPHFVHKNSIDLLCCHEEWTAKAGVTGVGRRGKFHWGILRESLKYF